MIKGFHTIWAPVSDMNRAVAFYRDLLQLEPNRISPYWSDFRVGANTLGLHPTPGGAAMVPRVGWMMSFEVSSVAKLKDLLIEANVPITEDFHETPSGVVLTFQDPDGNSIQAMEVGAILKEGRPVKPS